jgi:hypothetical protein
MHEWNEQAWIVYFLCDKDVTDTWVRMLNDDIPSACPEQVLTLWQSLLQMTDNQVVSALFQYVDKSSQIKTKVVLFTREDEGLLACNGISSTNLVTLTWDEMIDFLNWWSNLTPPDIPLTGVPQVYSKVFCCATNVKTVHLFTETHDMVSNTNIRLAQFNLMCKAAEYQASKRDKSLLQ